MESPNKVYLSREFNCSPQHLFDWLIKPERIAQWFGPKHLKAGKIHIDARVGGKYAVELWRPDGTSVIVEGVYREIDPPHHLIFDLQYQTQTGSAPPSLVSFHLEQIEENKTRLSLVQSFETIPLDMPLRTQAWEHMLGELERLTGSFASRQ